MSAASPSALSVLTFGYVAKAVERGRDRERVAGRCDCAGEGGAGGRAGARTLHSRQAVQQQRKRAKDAQQCSPQHGVRNACGLRGREARSARAGGGTGSRVVACCSLPCLQSGHTDGCTGVS